MIRSLPDPENFHWIGHANSAGHVIHAFDLSGQLSHAAFGKCTADSMRHHPAMGRRVWELLEPVDGRSQCQNMVSEVLSLRRSAKAVFERGCVRTTVELTAAPENGLDFVIRQIRSPFSSETARVIRRLMSSGMQVTEPAVFEIADDEKNPVVGTSQHIKHVADQLGVAPTTVRRHLQIAKRQAGCSNMSNFQFGAYCVLNGLVDQFGD